MGFVETTAKIDPSSGYSCYSN